MTLAAGQKETTDLVLVDLIDEITRRLQAGQPVDLRAYAAEHPDHAGELEKLLPALELLATLPAAREDRGTSSADPAARPAGENTSAAPDRMVGEYRVLREIGRGGMGVVYEAQQTSLDRRVALKIFPFAAALDPRRLQRFQNEARAAASLDHPNIVHVHSVGCDRGVHHYAMQYIEGQTLAEVIREGLGVGSEGLGDRGEGLGAAGVERSEPPESDPTDSRPHPSSLIPSPSSLSPHPPDTFPLAALSTETSPRDPQFFRTVARLGIQAAEALEHAHGLGVVHRDIKPSNLMVESTLPSPSGRGAGGEGRAAACETPHLWITDFGLAMTQTDANLTMTGDLLGTLRYMSPEQVQAKHCVLDHRTDVYSLGLTLYELLTLQPAFPGDDRQKLIRQVAEDDPCPPRQLNQAIPKDLETIVLKATAKEPESRYATAQELADDLRRVLEDKPIRARRPSLADRTRKWARRHRPLVASAVALLLTVSVLAGANGWNRYQRGLELERDVEQHLAAGRAFLASENFLAAERELTEARTRLDVAKRKHTRLTEAVAALSSRVSAKADAERRFREFQRLYDLIHTLVYSVDERKRTRAAEHCQVALELFGVIGDADPRGKSALAHLDEQQKPLVEEGSAELLYTLARVNSKEYFAGVSQHRRAIDLLRRIEEIYEPLPASYLWMAESYRELGDREAAADAVRQASSLSSDSALNHYMLATLHVHRDQPKLALEELARALEARPDHFASLLRSGSTLETLGQSEVAEAILTGAIAVNPRCPAAYRLRAGCRKSLHKFDLAMKDYAKLAELDPNDYFCPNGQALVLMKKGDFAGAVQKLDRALELNRYSHNSHLNRGHCYRMLGQRENAVADYDSVIECLTSQMQWIRRQSYSWKALGNASYYRWLLTKDAERSNDPYKEWIALAEEYPGAPHHSAKNTIAWRYVVGPVKIRNPQKALELVEAALKTSPDNPVYLNTLGVVYYRLGQYEQAVETLDKVIAIQGRGHFQDLIFLAMAHRQLGQTELAASHYEKALSLIQERELAEDVDLVVKEAADLFGGNE